MKFALIVGHTSTSKGMLAYNGEAEYLFSKRTAIEIAKQLECDIFYRSPLQTYEKQIDQLVEALQEAEITHAIELHLNAAPTKATGAEILCHYKSSDEEKARLSSFIADYCAYAGERNRGQKNLHEESRGFYLVNSCKKKKIMASIWEPCFSNWPNSGAKYVLEETSRYIQTMAVLCNKYFKTT